MRTYPHSSREPSKQQTQTGAPEQPAKPIEGQPCPQKVSFQIQGMHCASCEVLIERNLKKLESVQEVQVNHLTGQAHITCSRVPQLQDLQDAVKADGYTVLPCKQGSSFKPKAFQKKTLRDYTEMGAMALLFLLLFQIFSRLPFVPRGFGISQNMSYGFIFVIGLVASVSSCIAVTGGLLVAVAATYSERQMASGPFQKVKPYLFFNLGRVVSYTTFGALIGALGSVFTLSPRLNGVVTVLASVAMLLLGFQLLKLFPWARKLQPNMPKFLAHRIYDASRKPSNMAPLLVGAGTFFLPCGFTQALQLYVLSKGNAGTGALTMLAFSLGTLPALLSLGTLSGLITGTVQRYFLKFSGVLVILLGLFSLNNGLTLAGVPFAPSTVLAQIGSRHTQATGGTAAKVVDGKQVISMKVEGLEYVPSTFTVVQGVPVEWHVDGTQAEGCAQILTVPDLGLTVYLPPQGTKTIVFVPKQTGNLQFTCPMAMTTAGAGFTVVPNTQGIVPNPAVSASASGSGNPSSQGCSPDQKGCHVQKLNMAITEADGFSPTSFTVKKGMPVELTIDVQTVPAGCMNTMVIPAFNVAHTFTLGKNVLQFTPTDTGVFPITCSMGTAYGQLAVLN